MERQDRENSGLWLQKCAKMSSFPAGLEVPIPTLPDAIILTLSTPFVTAETEFGFAEVAP